MHTSPKKVVPGRLELPTSTLSVWRSNQLSYRTSLAEVGLFRPVSFFLSFLLLTTLIQRKTSTRRFLAQRCLFSSLVSLTRVATLSERHLQKGGVPAAPSGTATLLRLSPNHQFRSRPTLAVTDFKRPRLSWLDGRCVQGPGTYSPRHG